MMRKTSNEPNNTEVETTFKQCVTEKVKHSQALLKETAKKTQPLEMGEAVMAYSAGAEAATASAGQKGLDPSADFRKSIAQDLIEITNRLQKVRDKLAVREKTTDS